MATTAGTQNNTGDLLNTLIELTHDVNVAYTAAVDRTQDEVLLRGLHEMLAENEAQLGALRPYATRHAQNVSDQADAKGLLNHGAVRLASLIGEGPMLAALRQMQADMVVAYGRAVGYDQLPEGVGGLFKRHLEQAEGRLAWFDAQRAQRADGDFMAQRAKDQHEGAVGRGLAKEDARAPTLKQSSDY